MKCLAAMGLVVLAGCAKQKAPPPKQEPAAVAPSTGSAPDPAKAKEEARAQGVLGPSNSGFDDSQLDKGEGGSEQKAKTRDLQPVVGGSGAPAGKLTLGKVELASKGDGSPVTAALTKRLEELEACYQDALGSMPSLAGALTLSFTLKPDGSFGDITVKESALKNESLETCIVDSVKSAKLGKPLGKAPVAGSIALSFSPR